MDKLAIEGGTPVRATMLPYGQQWINGDDIANVIRTLESHFITQGPQIEKFEREIAEYVGAKYAVAFCNGTAALHAACFAAGIGPGDEVITSPITFLASSNCVLYQGARPVFADIKGDTYNIDPEMIKSCITPQTKAVIAVDFSGQPAEIAAIQELAQEHGLVVIQDAAHSLGAAYNGKRVGAWADMTMFSFHPVKHITTGEGGMIVTDSFEFCQRLQLFRSHGMTKSPASLLKNDGDWYYEMHELGYNYRMTDIQAALGSSQLNRLEEFVARRKFIAQAYNEAFGQLPGIQLPYQHPSTDSSWHLYVLRFKQAEFRVGRREIFDALRAENIGVHVHYIPVYSQPYYQKIGYTEVQCEQAERYYAEAISLPIFPKMVDMDIRDVIQSVNKVYMAYKK